ncbi:P27 family phage terminase small subunit [Agrobacterium tumefaciens]|uniref:P27 family phage terminase small subunit n=1 Tax=Agrobacterium tumefaciens TaxID=358 RepID=A0AA44JB90_AGRTU|nr:P27 family phage terminase small subunit [Agrobacterium tumefaciens]NSL24916.1 P27 family phage terminase small subunit [Agrobacterium tumefaciens]NTB86571.1 P27 family phage terminase small subunit [Agrobacterium tumefaciens]NTC20899.1 P27 family phage terminase small subunit [Agrobacterium tumefaciens]NTC30448.1 P27 family phage terminase small subunit [Agrobacterium tumefaciens]NTC54086.1 P27 family phage terminase small subunit [Agrobacterium tumefaciens]
MSVHNRGVKPAISRDSSALSKAPAPPKHFTSYARAEWKRIMPSLIERGIITRDNLGGVENYCIAEGAVKQIASAMAALPVPDLKLGGLQIRYAQTARQLASEYGLTPTSRARVGSAAADDDAGDNPLMVR